MKSSNKIIITKDIICPALSVPNPPILAKVMFINTKLIDAKILVKRKFFLLVK